MPLVYGGILFCCRISGASGYSQKLGGVSLWGIAKEYSVTDAQILLHYVIPVPAIIVLGIIVTIVILGYVLMLILIYIWRRINARMCLLPDAGG